MGWDESLKVMERSCGLRGFYSNNDNRGTVRFKPSREEKCRVVTVLSGFNSALLGDTVSMVRWGVWHCQEGELLHPHRYVYWNMLD